MTADLALAAHAVAQHDPGLSAERVLTVAAERLTDAERERRASAWFRAHPLT